MTGQSSAPTRAAGQVHLGFSLSPAERALSLAARYYIYGAGYVSKSTFDDPHFRAMLTGYYQAGGGRGTPPFLTRRGLLSFVNAEFSLLLKLMGFMAQLCYKKALGNPFAQQLHDGATLRVRSQQSLPA